MTTTLVSVIAGVDTHADTHHAAVVTTTGAHLGDQEFATSVDGYRQLTRFITTFGQVQSVGVEGTNSYGAALTRYLRQAGIRVREVIRPKRAVRRRRGKSDPIDAYAAAEAVLAGDDLPTPKSADGDVEAIRVLHAARRSAVKARANASRQIKSLLVTAPDFVRAHFRGLSDKNLLAALGAVRPGPALDGVEQATLHALRHLARRHRYLTSEIAQLEMDLDALVRRVAPALRAAQGIGLVTAAQLLITAGDNPERLKNEAAFAALCGVAPIPASSGKTTRYRLCRGGDRQANCALHQVVLVRMSCDPRTRTYVAKRTAEGKSTREIMRCLKRTLAREVYHLLTHPAAVPRTDDLRPLRLARGLTLETARATSPSGPQRSPASNAD
jgi:transposase